DRLEPDPAEENSAERAAHREDETLGQKLPEESRLSSTERGPHGELALAGRRTRHEQVRDVGARNEQHERHGASEQNERIMKVDELRRTADERDERRLRIRRRLDVGGDRIELVRRRRDVGSRAKATKDVKTEILVFEVERKPQIDPVAPKAG